MLLFSVHPNIVNLGNHAYYSKGFIVRPSLHLKQIGSWLTSQLNSPIVWTYGIRKDSNFQSSSFCVLDVDDGPALEDAVKCFADYAHILGTTKSHQKDKGGKIRDRYRVFIQTECKLVKTSVYKHMNELLARQYGGDIQAVGGHMAFMPLREIISVRDKGKLLPVIEPPPKMVRKEKWTSNAIYSGERRMPRYIKDYLEIGPADGERNLTCFKVASGLSRAGFHEDEIVAIILDSRIPLDHSERVQREIRSAVRNAIRRN